MFSGRRLLLAREQRALTQSELARRVVDLGGQLTPAAISQFENGEARPKTAHLTLLAASLDHPVEFFAAGSADPPISSDSAFFRSLRSTTARERRATSSLGLYSYILARALGRYVDLPAFDLPLLPLEEGQESQVAAHAKTVRADLGLGDGPVDNVVRTLEQRGVIVIRVEGLVTTKVDAFSLPIQSRPVVVLGGDKGDWSRSRFDAAHELGHVVLHTAEALGRRWAEDQAHAFSAEFLAPAESIRPELPPSLEWDKYLSLKEKWGVSVQALIRRARDLRVIADDVYLRAVKLMSAWGWRKPNGEPGQRRPLEEPRVIFAAIAALRDLGVLDELLGEVGIPNDVVGKIARKPMPSVSA